MLLGILPGRELPEVNKCSFELKWAVREPLSGKIPGTAPQQRVLGMVTGFTDQTFNLEVWILKIQLLSR